jgi:hypothetical protein
MKEELLNEISQEISDRAENGETRKEIFKSLSHIEGITQYFVNKHAKFKKPSDLYKSILNQQIAHRY